MVLALSIYSDYVPQLIEWPCPGLWSKQRHSSQATSLGLVAPKTRRASGRVLNLLPDCLFPTHLNFTSDFACKRSHFVVFDVFGPKEPSL